MNVSTSKNTHDNDKKVDAHCSKLIENYKIILKSSQVDVSHIGLPSQNFEELQTMVATDNIVSQIL
jgi:hypothetical protein